MDIPIPGFQITQMDFIHLFARTQSEQKIKKHPAEFNPLTPAPLLQTQRHVQTHTFAQNQQSHGASRLLGFG